MSLLKDYMSRIQSELPQGPATRLTPAEMQEFLAEIRRGDQVLEALLSAEDKNSCPTLAAP